MEMSTTRKLCTLNVHDNLIDWSFRYIALYPIMLVSLSLACTLICSQGGLYEDMRCVCGGVLWLRRATPWVLRPRFAPLQLGSRGLSGRGQRGVENRLLLGLSFLP